MDPILLYPISEVCSPTRVWRLMNEVQDMDLHVIDTFMVTFIEMSAHRGLKDISSDIVEMALEPVHEPPFSLTDILFLASLASDAVYEVG